MVLPIMPPLSLSKLFLILVCVSLQCTEMEFLHIQIKQRHEPKATHEEVSNMALSVLKETMKRNGLADQK